VQGKDLKKLKGAKAVKKASGFSLYYSWFLVPDLPHTLRQAAAVLRPAMACKACAKPPLSFVQLWLAKPEPFFVRRSREYSGRRWSAAMPLRRCAVAPL